MVVLIDFEGFQHKDSPMIIKELAIYDLTAGYLWHTILPPPPLKINNERRKQFMLLTTTVHGLDYHYNPYNTFKYDRKIKDASSMIRSLNVDQVFAKGLDKANRLSQLLSVRVDNLEDVLPAEFQSSARDKSLPCTVQCPYNHLFHTNCAIVRVQHFAKVLYAMTVCSPRLLNF